MNTRHRNRTGPLLIAVAAAMLLLVSIAAIALVLWLRPSGDDWRQTLRLGPVSVPVSVEKIVRLASGPRLSVLLDGRTVHTAMGTWKVSANLQEVRLVCAPCLLGHPSVGPVPLRIDRISATLSRTSKGYSGMLHLGSNGRQISIPWSGVVDSTGALIELRATALPMADLIAVLGKDIPEIRSAAIYGQLSVRMQLRFPGPTVDARWKVQGFHVAGLGTERLLHASLPGQCAAPSRSPVSGWLPAAVIAAEDQKFQTHPGYDISQIEAALRSNGQEGALHGASTLTQQLARLIFTGGERTPQRKLRELLYAVEMEETLGKARILQLYLALAPWGDQLCGAENAAQRYLGKSANAVTPAEAAWLASLLVNPDRQLQRTQAAGVDTVRITRIVRDMRPMSPRQRQRALADQNLNLTPAR